MVSSTISSTTVPSTPDFAEGIEGAL
jgi:hypothetical protein